MYDFTNLSDVEFEKLSADILSRKFNSKLRYFAPGRDGGIDLVDDVYKKNIVVQVKHYARSSASSLINSLKKEVEKVENLQPVQYYVCVSQNLTASNILDIYNLFEEYMDDTSNIITRIELVDFLNQESNQDILRRNFKLWLLSDKLLKDIFNNQVFIDSEVLLDDINEEFHYFVQTKVFEEALDTLRDNRLLLIYGAPGVGKSINSKMLASVFVKEDYIIRYTTDANVSTIKKVISENPDVKEVIILDDCLGQYYFKLKDGQDRELISLIKYIKHHKNKVLIMNTRVTVLNEAKRTRLELRRFLEQKKLPLKTIDMEDTSISEKAEIFYNHLKKNNIPKTYFETLRKNKNYRNIIEHHNYNPRIIEFVTQEHRYNEVNASDYYEYILENLTNPQEVWEDEFSEKLDEVDRIFMHTLFSLTDTHIDMNILKECFIFRLQNEGRSHTTVDLFSNTKARLTKSLVKILDVNGSPYIGVLNPSINDYLNSHLSTNEIGLKAIKKSILYLQQLEKMYTKNKAEKVIIDRIHSGNFLTLRDWDNKKYDYLFYCIAKNRILKEEYKPIIKDNFGTLKENFIYLKTTVDKKEIVLQFIEEEALFNFYNISENLKDENFINDFIREFDFKGILQLLAVLENKGILHTPLQEQLNTAFIEELDGYLDNINIDEIIEENEGFEIFYKSMPSEKSSEIFDRNVKELWVEVRNDIKKDILNILGPKLSCKHIEEQLKESIELNITINSIYDAFDRHNYQLNYEPDYDDFEDYQDYELRGYNIDNSNDADAIFDRDIK